MATGANLLVAADAAGAYVPRLCWAPGLTVDGACGLYVVAVGGQPVLACETQAEPGMVVDTTDPAAVAIRRRRLELVKADHANDCELCPKNERCALQEASRAAGVDVHVQEKLAYPAGVDKSHPFFDLDRTRCILCGSCVKACRDLQGLGALEIVGSGFSRRVRGTGDVDLGATNCESCGLCVDLCPTASLLPKVYQVPTEEVRTVCPYCGVGCTLYLGLYDGQLSSVRADPDGPANRGALCVKGRFGLVDVVNSTSRLEAPQIRDGSGVLRVASWDEALDTVANGLKKHVEKDSFAMLASAKATTEEGYLLQKFTRAVMRTNSVDHCARLCHAPTVTALAQTFGSGAMTGSIDDVEHADCLFVIGSNTTETHPVIGARIRRVHQSGTPLLVADPRGTDLARRADLWLRNLPGSDTDLLGGMARVIVEEGYVDAEFIRERTEGYDELAASLQAFTPALVEERTGVPWTHVHQAARMIARSDATLFLFAMGSTQHAHGTENVRAVSDLALLTGHIGRKGAGVAPLRGHNNVQGTCDVGCLPDLLPGYQPIADPEARARVGEVWGEKPPIKPGLGLTDMWDAILEGHIRAMWVVGENPLLSEPDSKKAEKALRALDLLIVQDPFPTGTADLAHVVLPATTFAEKDGTFTNTERRIQLVRKALEPVAGSRTDLEIVCEVAKRMGAAGFDFESASDVMDEIAQVAPIYGGVSHARVAASAEGLQWPCPTADHPGTSTLHTDGFPRPGGRAAFAPLVHHPVAEACDHDYPLVLVTGRTLAQFHTGSMTRRVSGLNEMRGEEQVEIHPVDARGLGIEDRDVVRVTSRRGTLTVRAHVTDRSPQGSVFMTFHFSETPVNRLTIAARDPESGIAEAKVCAVKVEPTGEGDLADLP